MTAYKRADHHKGERGIWQRRYWEHTIRDELDTRRHVNYIYFNPVKHGHCDRVSEWPYSSFYSHVEKGFYPEDWGFDSAHLDDYFGESPDSWVDGFHPSYELGKRPIRDVEDGAIQAT